MSKFIKWLKFVFSGVEVDSQNVSGSRNIADIVLQEKQQREDYLKNCVDGIIRRHMVVSSVQVWMDELVKSVPDLTKEEKKYCEVYMYKRGFSGWEKWREH